MNDLVERVQRGLLSEDRVRVAAYLGHADAEAAVGALNLAPLPPPRRVLSPMPSAGLKQWILGLADVCDPSDRVPLARRALAILLARVGHDHDGEAIDDLLAREKPWSVMRIVAGWGEHVLSEEEDDDDEPIRFALREGLRGWLLGPRGLGRRS